MSTLPVLIVGGGPVGLSASIFLSAFGIRSLLVERHPGTSIVPKARGINARTMEIYRQFGVEAAIRSAGLPPEKSGLIVWTESLAGREIERRVPGRASPRNQGMSPVANCLCAQDDLEPVLRRFAEAQAPAELRFDTEFLSVTQDADGVDAVLLDRRTGVESSVRAQYVIAADGNQSRIRRLVGARMIGPEKIYDSVNMVFNADLRPWTAHRPSALYFVEQPDLRGTFLTINAHDRWGFLIHSLSQYGFTPADFTDERCIAMIRQAVGVADLPVRMLGLSAWEASAFVADQYRHGRIFLTGDAAHEMPPTGGFGMNTGVQDVHNLSWKLAAVLRGEAGDSLLDTYHAERQPWGTVTTKVALDNCLSMGRTERQAGAKLPRAEFLSEQGLIFGASYDSAAVIPDGTMPEVNDSPITQYLPSARPGARAPHVWLWRDGERISTVDLFGPWFTLLTGPEGAGWREAFAGRPGVVGYTVGFELEDRDGGWLAAYGLAVDGAVLVRPDGQVAWRSLGGVGDAVGVLAWVFEGVIRRGG